MSDPLDRNRQPTPSPPSVWPPRLVAWGALAAVVLLAPAPAAAADTSPGGTGQGDVTQLVAAVDPAVVTIHRPGGTGSGFVVDERGILVTNCHVVEGAAEAVAVFPDKTTFRVVGFLAFAPGKDLALLKIDPGTRKLATLPLSAAAPAKGEKVYAFGAPLGLSGSVSDGLVAAVRRGPEVREILKELTGRDVYVEGLGYDLEADWIQTTAPISHGNSGGPLVNARGEVVGVNTWGPQSGQNLNFAVSAAHIRQLLRDRALVARPLADLPQSAHAGSASSRHAGSASSRRAGSIPRGWVRIVNRCSGLICGVRASAPEDETATASHWQIERSGAFFKIRNRDSGQCLALSEPSKKSGRRTCQVPDSEDACVFWKIEPTGAGFWRLINRDTGTCLESYKNDRAAAVRNSPPRDGALEQHWQLEKVADARAARAAPTSPAAGSAQAAPAAPAAEGYVGSRNSTVFHRASCKTAANISEKNLVRYSSRDEALQAGKKPCHVCKP
jgi:S1-C subfamily serine protease